MSDIVRFGEADLTSCDREPIHIPESIQPHGVLLAVDRRNLTVKRFAGDTRFLLGIEPQRLANLSLHDLFADSALTAMAERLRQPADTVAPSVVLGLQARAGPAALDATVHARGDIGIVELEPARHGGGDPLAQVKSMMAALASVGDFEASCRAAVAQVRAATGFDRVLVYRFLHDDSGKVVAEEKADGVDSFLGLHYPASDIPKQARELYRRNWLRLIPDVGYAPAPMQPPATPVMPPLDMSDCALRSVSPLHLEYLRNMGVTASMSISIVLGDRLWGLIACHHYSPRHVPADLRIACELFAQIFSLHLEARIAADVAQRRLAARHAHEDLTADLLRADNVATALIGGKTTLLDLIPAGGVAVWYDGRLSTLGETPPASFIAELVAWLNVQDRPVYDTYRLSAEFAPAEAHLDTASGLLAVSLSRSPRDYVLWFRPEVVRTVSWAGDPRKPAEVGAGAGRLTPRKSFETWQETVRRQSQPWEPVDVEVASGFRVLLLETALRQVDAARREREAAIAHQAMLMAELDHRVKNMLAGIQGLVRQTKTSAATLDGFVATLERRIRAMANAHDQLAATRWHGASVASLVRTEVAPYTDDRRERLRIAGDDVLLSPRAALPLTLAIHELTTNAAKYGALAAPDGRIEVTWQREADGGLSLSWTERGGPAVTHPERRGFGSLLIERGFVHETRGSSILSFEPDGVRCVLTIPAEHVKPSGPVG